jgi:DNA-binding SARP family transcriptional activator
VTEEGYAGPCVPMADNRIDTPGPRAAARLHDLAAPLLAELPFGILVADGTGTLQAWNAAARRLLGDDPQLAEEAAGSGVRCCDVCGCRAPDGPLADACITELALEAADVLPEVRIDVPRGGAAWITASPAARGGVVLQVRPASPRDRRRRTDPHWTAQPHLYVEVLGRTQVRSGETQLGGRWLAQRPGQLLKFMVATRGRSVHTEEIAHALWPEGGTEAPSNVRHHMHALRRRLEPRRPNRAPSQFVVTRGGGYQLDRALVTVDADSFIELADAGLRAAREGNQAHARARLAEAARLYGGEFLADEPYAEWALDERDRLGELAARALHVLADLDRAAGDLEAAHRHLRRLAELEPLDTHVQRELLEVCLRRGRRTEATRRYQALRMRTMRELGQEPGFSLADLADEVGEGRSTWRR